MATPSFKQKITDDGTLEWLYSVYSKAVVDDIVGARSDTALATWIAEVRDIHGEPEEEWTDREYWILNNTDFVGDTELRDSGASDRTLGDLYDVREMLMKHSPETYRELNEALFANGWYGQGATAESLDNRGASERAFHSAVNELVGQSNSSPIRWEGMLHQTLMEGSMEDVMASLSVDFTNLGNTPFTDTTTDGEMRLTEDQINSMSDNAAQTVFGRAPSDQEKMMVLNLVRGLEASGVHRPGASDARAELRRAAPVEARTQDMSGVLQNFMSIVAGR
jgi:hypothetical protein